MHSKIIINRIGGFAKFIRTILVFMIFIMGYSKFSWGCSAAQAIVTPPAMISIDTALPVGTVLASATLSWPSVPIPSDGCTRSLGGTYTWKMFGEGEANGNYYATSIPGVSYRIKINGWPSNFNGYFPVTTTYPYNSGSTYVSGGSVYFELIKTGATVIPTDLLPQPLGHVTVDGKAFYDIVLLQAIPIKPTNPACTVTKSVIPVTLASVTSGKLKGTGTTYGDTTFNIPLNCKSASNISLSFTGSAMVDNANGVFLNNDSITGSSVGVQILDREGNPVSASVGELTTIGELNGDLSYPMTARYYSLVDTVPAGDVVSTVYATIVYN